MRTTRSSRTAEIAHALITISFCLGVTVLTLVAAVFVYRAAVGQLHYSILAGIDHAKLVRLPRHVSATGDLPVTVDVRHVSFGLVLVTAIRYLVFAISGLVAVWMLRGLIGTARAGDPFVAENVRRLRVIGLVLLLYPPLSSLSHMVLESVYIQRDAALARVLEPRAFELNVLTLLAGLSVLVLAQVFARGVELRTDLEGTI
jgi:hypothetical protein